MPPEQSPSPGSDKPDESITPAEAETRIEALLGADKPDDEEQPPRPPKPEEETPPDSPPPQQLEPGENVPEPEEDNAAAEGQDAQADGETFVIEDDKGQAWALPKELEPAVMRQRDYTQKTQELSEGRKQLIQAAQALMAERQKYAESLPKIEEFLSSIQMQEPDWAALAQHPDPSEYIRMQVRWTEHQRQQEIVAAEKEKVAQLQQLDMIEKLQNHLAQSSQVLVEAIPSWKNEKQATADKVALKEYAKKSGFSDWEIDHAYDHRVLVWGHKARLYDEMMGKARPRPQQPGNGLRPMSAGAAVNQHTSKVTRVTRAKQRLAKTGKPRDAEDAILAIIETGGL